MSDFHLHVGTAKSGTTWLQRVLARNRSALRDAGVLYPGTGQSQYLAALDLRGQGAEYAAADGAWERLVAAAREHDGPVLLSHERLTHLTPEQVDRVVADATPRAVRIVVTARDLGRQLPAVWQERVKNRGHQRWDRFLDQVERDWRDGDPEPDAPFWRTQDLAGLLGRFAGLPVTVVTVPPPGGPPAELWRRFAEACGLPADLAVDLDVGGGNSSMGRTEAEVLRLMNQSLPADLPWRRYERRVKNTLVPQRLAGRAVDGPIVVPEPLRPRVEEYADRVRAAVAGSGARVVGDLDDLRPRFADGPTDPPDPVRVLAVATGLVADLLVERDRPEK